MGLQFVQDGRGKLDHDMKKNRKYRKFSNRTFGDKNYSKQDIGIGIRTNININETEESPDVHV